MTTDIKTFQLIIAQVNLWLLWLLLWRVGWKGLIKWFTRETVPEFDSRDHAVEGENYFLQAVLQPYTDQGTHSSTHTQTLNKLIKCNKNTKEWGGRWVGVCLWEHSLLLALPKSPKWLGPRNKTEPKRQNKQSQSQVPHRHNSWRSQSWAPAPLTWEEKTILITISAARPEEATHSVMNVPTHLHTYGMHIPS